MQQYIFQGGKTYFRAAKDINFRASIDILEQYYIFQRRRYVHGEDTVRTHGEKDKIELYGDGEFGIRSGRIWYRPGIDRYGPGDK